MVIVLISYELVKFAVGLISNEAGEVTVEKSATKHVFVVVEPGVVEYTKGNVLAARIYTKSGRISEIEVYGKYTTITF